MKQEMDEMKQEINAVFPFASECREALTELTGLKQAIGLALQEAESLVGTGENGLGSQIHHTKAIIRELQLHLDNRALLEATNSWFSCFDRTAHRRFAPGTERSSQRRGRGVQDEDEGDGRIARPASIPSG